MDHVTRNSFGVHHVTRHLDGVSSRAHGAREDIMSHKSQRVCVELC